jgi:transposase-like protein
MPEVRKIESQHVDERCPVCGTGWMRPTGVSMTGVPPQYEHQCTACGYKQNYQIRYPYIVQ